MLLTRSYPIATKKAYSAAVIQLTGSLIYREEIERQRYRGHIYLVELTERKSEGENDRDVERDLDRDGDRCPNYFMFLQQDIQALHLSDKSLSSLVSCQNWRSIGELDRGRKCLDTGQPL